MRGPLSALRTLGAMLVPRTQDVTRDVADGIVVQVMHHYICVRALWVFAKINEALNISAPSMILPRCDSVMNAFLVHGNRLDLISVSKEVKVEI